MKPVVPKLQRCAIYTRKSTCSPPSCGPVSFRRSSMALRRRISRSPASPWRCPIPRPIDDIRLGRIASFAEIAEREVQGERHIRLLAPLAFLSPRIIAAIVDGTAPADLTVTGLAKTLPYSWCEQERSIRL